MRVFVMQIGVSVKNQNRMANSVEPDEMAHYEPSHQDLNCLQKHCFSLQGRKGSGAYFVGANLLCKF